MRLKFLLLIALMLFTLSTNSQSNKFIDFRDGIVYKTIKIGEQLWMAENLKYKLDGSFDNGIRKYGRLYIFEAALIACPSGWHLPNEKELEKLINYYGGNLTAGKYLRIDGTSGFDARYGGFRKDNGIYLDKGNSAVLWTSKEIENDIAWGYYIDRDFDNIVQFYFNKTYALSVRCIFDN